MFWIEARPVPVACLYDHLASRSSRPPSFQLHADTFAAIEQASQVKASQCIVGMQPDKCCESGHRRRVSERARSNKATRDELVGSTITVTSLGKLGGIASTPVINAPEVAIIGLNKAVDRPVVHDGAVIVRRIMNLSSSFDHRFVDGYDAAAMIQTLKDLLEHPATIFIPKVKTP